MFYLVTWNLGLFRAHQENNRFRSDVLKAGKFELCMYSSAWILWGIVVCDGELEHKKAKWGWQVCAFLTTSPLTIGKFKFKERVTLSSSWSEWAAQTSANISWPLAKAPSVCDAVLKSSYCQGPASPVATWRFWCKCFWADRTFHPNCVNN